MTSGLHKIEFPELVSNNSTRQDPGLISLEGLRAVPARLEVHVGEVRLTVGELLSAQAGQVLRLDREVNSLVDLVLEGHVIARGRLVAVDEHFGIQLTELPRKDP